MLVNCVRQECVADAHKREQRQDGGGRSRQLVRSTREQCRHAYRCTAVWTENIKRHVVGMLVHLPTRTVENKNGHVTSIPVNYIVYVRHEDSGANTLLPYTTQRGHVITAVAKEG